MTNQAIRKIVVVGGGSAGWLTAGRIAAEHQHNPLLQVVLVESPNVPVIGVGEGTWPTMRSTLMKLGISETDFIRECEASFKQGAKFCQWVTGTDDDYYYHPLMLPQGFGKTDLVSHWFEQCNGESFSNTVCFQEAICEQGLAPKSIRTAEYSAVANYAYHLDAGKFTLFLQKHCTDKLGVKHIQADVQGVNSADNGDIRSLSTQQAGEISGDLFVDCTGFASLLLGQHYQVPFVDCSDVLFIDSAIAVQVPYADQDAPIASHTISSAREAGWIWDIGLQHRRGIGHVYASQYTTEDKAMADLEAYVGPQFKHLKTRKIPIRSGHRQHFWQNNCVAVGLSAGFLEPLEASALVLVELSAQMIAEQLPACRQVMDIIANRFNDTFHYRWQRIIDFLKLHYLLSRRSDNKFWLDNRDPDTIPQSLQDMMQWWQYHPPCDRDFTSNNEVFPAASYQYVLYGMGFTPNTAFAPPQAGNQQLAMQQFAINRKNTAQALQSLPTNRDLLKRIQQYGLQAI